MPLFDDYSRYSSYSLGVCVVCRQHVPLWGFDTLHTLYVCVMCSMPLFKDWVYFIRWYAVCAACPSVRISYSSYSIGECVMCSMPLVEDYSRFSSCSIRALCVACPTYCDVRCVQHAHRLGFEFLHAMSCVMCSMPDDEMLLVCSCMPCVLLL